ncbi:MAG: hypothetical protein ABI837_13455 [Acidobacteriota bacterium]
MPHSTTTTDNVGVLTSGNVVAVPFIVAKDGLALAGSGFYNFRVGDSTTNRGFLIGYDTSGQIGLLSAVGTSSVVAIWTANSSSVFAEKMRVDGAGNVGIGTAAPIAKLDVNGDVNVAGNIAAKYQDMAEWVPSTEHMVSGTVVVLNLEKSNEVTASTRSYDTAVAGVVSAKPGLILGEASKSKEKIATTGRVMVRSDASNGAIHVGDLLVTSDKPGMAMRSVPVVMAGVKMHRPGTIVGKALQPLESGQGEILVLLTLQ